MKATNDSINKTECLCSLICMFMIILVRPKKKIAVFPLTRPTLIFCADPAVFIAILKENKKIFIRTDP